jgi:hypothetical protein
MTARVYWQKCPLTVVSKTATPGSIPGSPVEENAPETGLFRFLEPIAG